MFSSCNIKAVKITVVWEATCCCFAGKMTSCCCCVCLLRRAGHLHDRRAEEVLQCHEETGLQETSEAHPQTSGSNQTHFTLPGPQRNFTLAEPTGGQISKYTIHTSQLYHVKIHIIDQSSVLNIKIQTFL